MMQLPKIALTMHHVPLYDALVAPRPVLPGVVVPRSATPRGRDEPPGLLVVAAVYAELGEGNYR